MAGKRELIEPHKGDKRYVRRDAKQDRKRHAKTASKPGYGDRGDRKK
jgi:hypothetical protein